MKTKMGRPKLPKGQAKSFQIGVRFNGEDIAVIKGAVSKSGCKAADWARNTLLSVAKKS